jgi:uncharacterized OsmC-like protein
MEMDTMSARDLTGALRRAEAVLQRRPSAGLHDDAGAAVRWEGGTRMTACHGDGHVVVTDLPGELGGAGGAVSPGWMVRAGLAACTATAIVMTAALEGIELTALEVSAGSRSDLRGLLGVPDADGGLVPPGPQDLFMKVTLAAPGVSAERLRALVETSQRRAPMTDALEQPQAIALHIEIAEA